MKQIIMNVLDDMSESQINLASETARETVSSLISAALKTKGSYKEYTEYELDEQEARASWVCSICGENTFEVDSDYIGTGTNHLGCELKIDIDNKAGINPNDDSDYYTGPDGSYEINKDWDVVSTQPDKEKLSPYECGFEAFDDARGRFDVRFYLVAILFIIFDLEVAFLFPWAVSLGKIGVFGFWSMMFFLLVLTIGFVYEWKKGALEWE